MSDLTHFKSGAQRPAVHRREPRGMRQGSRKTVEQRFVPGATVSWACTPMTRQVPRRDGALNMPIANRRLGLPGARERERRPRAMPAASSGPRPRLRVVRPYYPEVRDITNPELRRCSILLDNARVVPLQNVAEGGFPQLNGFIGRLRELSPPFVVFEVEASIRGAGRQRKGVVNS